MDRDSKEAQDKALFVPRTPCANRSGQDLLDCLYEVPAETLHAAMPPSYSYFAEFYDYPVDKRGLGAHVSTLLYMDGVTVSMPPEKALRSGLHDVPVLFQNTQAEMDLFPISDLFGVSAADLETFLDGKFAPAFGREAAAELYALYNETTAVAPEYTAYAVDADSALSCGIRAMLLAAQAPLQAGLRSPVYWGLVTEQPGDVVHNRRFPYHGWDVQAASRTWDLSRVSKDYRPTPRDVQFGNVLLDQWSQLATSGTLDAASWTPVQWLPRGEVTGSTIRSDGIRRARQLKADICSFWQSRGVGEQWWWIN